MIMEMGREGKEIRYLTIGSKVKLKYNTNEINKGEQLIVDDYAFDVDNKTHVLNFKGKRPFYEIKNIEQSLEFIK